MYKLTVRENVKHQITAGICLGIMASIYGWIAPTYEIYALSFNFFITEIRNTKVLLLRLGIADSNLQKSEFSTSKSPETLLLLAKFADTTSVNINFLGERTIHAQTPLQSWK